MTRLDKLTDQHEGSLTAQTVEAIDTYLKANGQENGWTEQNAAFYERSRSNTFICCWHLNEYESEAMWRLYCGTDGGVAVQTTYSNLVESISTEYDTYVGLVRYVDYATTTFESGNAFWPVMHKRAAFSHEQEVRLVRYWGDPPYPDTSPNELHHPWDIERLTSQIWVDPYQQKYFYDAVRAILERFMPSLLPKLCWSSMKTPPTYEKRNP